MDIANANAVVGLADKAFNLFKALLGKFKSSRSRIAQLECENAALKQALDEKPPKPQIRQVGNVNYYFVEDQGPYCNPCYHERDKLIPLDPRQKYGSGYGRMCRVCHQVFVEEQAPLRLPPIEHWWQ